MTINLPVHRKYKAGSAEYGKLASRSKKLQEDMERAEVSLKACINEHQRILRHHSMIQGEIAKSYIVAEEQRLSDVGTLVQDFCKMYRKLLDKLGHSQTSVEEKVKQLDVSVDARHQIQLTLSELLERQLVSRSTEFIAKQSEPMIPKEESSPSEVCRKYTEDIKTKFINAEVDRYNRLRHYLLESWARCFALSGNMSEMRIQPEDDELHTTEKQTRDRVGMSEHIFSSVRDSFCHYGFEPDFSRSPGFNMITSLINVSSAAMFHLSSVEYFTFRAIQLILLSQKTGQSSIVSSMSSSNIDVHLQNVLRNLVRDIFFGDTMEVDYHFQKNFGGKLENGELAYCITQPLLSIIPLLRTQYNIKASKSTQSTNDSSKSDEFLFFDDGVFFRLCLLRQYLSQERLTIVQRAEGILRQVFAILTCMHSSNQLSDSVISNSNLTQLINACSDVITGTFEDTLSSPTKNIRRQSRAAAKSSSFRSLEVAVDAFSDFIDNTVDTSSEVNSSGTNFEFLREDKKKLNVNILHGGTSAQLRCCYLQSVLAPIFTRTQRVDTYGVIKCNDLLLSLADIQFESSAGGIPAVSFLLERDPQLTKKKVSLDTISPFIETCFCEALMRQWSTSGQESNQTELDVLHPSESRVLLNILTGTETTDTYRENALMRLFVCCGSVFTTQKNETGLSEAFYAVLTTVSSLLEYKFVFLKFSNKVEESQTHEGHRLPCWLEDGGSMAPDITQVSELSLWLLDSPIDIGLRIHNENQFSGNLSLRHLYASVDTYSSIASTACQRLEQSLWKDTWEAEVKVAIFSKCFCPGGDQQAVLALMREHSCFLSHSEQECITQALRFGGVEDDILELVEFFGQAYALANTDNSQNVFPQGYLRMQTMSLNLCFSFRRISSYYERTAKTSASITVLWSTNNVVVEQYVSTIGQLYRGSKSLANIIRPSCILVHSLISEVQRLVDVSIPEHRKELLRRTTTKQELTSQEKGCFWDLPDFCAVVEEFDEKINFLFHSYEKSQDDHITDIKHCLSCLFADLSHWEKMPVFFSLGKWLDHTLKKSESSGTHSTLNYGPVTEFASAHVESLLALQKACFEKYTTEVASQQVDVWRSIERSIGFGPDGFHVVDTTLHSLASRRGKTNSSLADSSRRLDEYLGQFCDTTPKTEEEDTNGLWYGLSDNASSTLAVRQLCVVFENLFLKSSSGFHARSKSITKLTGSADAMFKHVQSKLTKHLQACLQSVSENYVSIICEGMNASDLINIAPPLPGKENQHPKWKQQTTFRKPLRQSGVEESSAQGRMVANRYGDDMRLRYASKQNENALKQGINLGTRIQSVAVALKQKCSTGGDVQSLVPPTMKSEERFDGEQEQNEQLLPRVPSLDSANYQISAAILHVYSQRVNDVVDIMYTLLDIIRNGAATLEGNDSKDELNESVLSRFRQGAADITNFIAVHFICFQTRYAILYRLYRPRPLQYRLSDILDRLTNVARNVSNNLRPPCNRMFLIRCIECASECWVRATLLDHRAQSGTFFKALHKLHDLRQDHHQLTGYTTKGIPKDSLKDKASSFFKRAFGTTTRSEHSADSPMLEDADTGEIMVPPKSVPPSEGYVIAQDVQMLKRWFVTDTSHDILQTMERRPVIARALGYNAGGVDDYQQQVFWEPFKNAWASGSWGLDLSDAERMLNHLIRDFVPLLNMSSHELIETFENFVNHSDDMLHSKMDLPLALSPLPTSTFVATFDRKLAAALLIIHRASDGCKESAKLCSRRKLVESFGWWK